MEFQLISLHDGHRARVSPEDYARLAAHSWRAKRDRFGKWYAYRTVIAPDGGERRSSLHREVYGAGPGEVVVPRDRDFLNCTRENLQYLKRREYANNPRLGASGERYVVTLNDGTFTVQIGKRTYGNRKTLAEAVVLRDAVLEERASVQDQE